MKQLTCEMCGSTDMIKKDGVFVCQSCGTKYSIEEAKKMMVEGTVDVQGTVKVDNTELVANYLVMANNAQDAGNNKEAESYCNKAIEIDPTNADAWLLKGIAAGWQSTLANLRIDEFITCANSAFQNAPTCDKLDELGVKAFNSFYSLALAVNKLKLNHVVSFPDTYQEQYLSYPVTVILWRTTLLSQLTNAINALKEKNPEDQKTDWSSIEKKDFDVSMKEACVSSGIELWNNSLKDYNSDQYPSDYTFEKMKKNGNVAMVMLSSVIPADTSKIADNEKQVIIRACKNLITMKSTYMNIKSYTVSFSNGIESHPVKQQFLLSAKQEMTKDIRKYHETIKLCDPSYDIPFVADPTTTNSGGCYVATAVYGSYDCPQVWTLRRFRDDTLAEIWHGRAFIHTYYAVSPTLVKWFGETDWFKKLWKGKLDRMVAGLQAKGVESTPYEDKNW